MQPINYPVKHKVLESFWQSYFTLGRIPAIVGQEPDPMVLASWRRCAPRFDALALPHPVKLHEQALRRILMSQSSLVTFSNPFIEDIHQFIEGSNCAIVLTDGSGCILQIGGDEEAVGQVKQTGFEVGMYWAEEYVGTTAFGLAMIEAMPVQVVGAEHFLQALHPFVTTAAPIHQVNGRIIGIIGIIGPVSSATSHTISLVMAVARAIANQLQADLYLEEANYRLTEMNTILGAIQTGVISWDETGKVNHINALAGQMLQVSPSSILGRPYQEMIDLPPDLHTAVSNHQELSDVEASLDVNGHTVECLVSLLPITYGSSISGGCIAMLRPMEHVRRLVHQQVGTQAALVMEDMPVQSTVMRSVMRQARTAARGTAPVLLRGEGGVGKNHLARAVHNDSERGHMPFLAINCRAIPHELMISEFLGQEQGANTDGRPSKFELANGGTLMFDQIESLSLEMQAALLHVIETGHVMRLGSSRAIPVDVRIIGATSDDLEKLVAAGHFLPHLYYRFGVFNITIPPVRERTEDIPLLAERFLARISQRDGRAAWIDDEATAVLRRYPWPGNVRELESILERALHHSNDNTIRVADLPETVRSGRLVIANSPQAEPVLTTAEAEREAIIRAGWACQGHVSEMSKQLGIGRTTLWRKMKRLKLDPNQFKQPQ
ncbi:MAG: PTS-dependent dihydroxyacetone kinase operon transcriptional regulator DhaR [Ardenticatenaceae bacterium]|nr:PTS-dependent dihydroxyacetone kinase operon transcriptional regulator DhaR [Ardenticatenaceae bacterium]